MKWVLFETAPWGHRLRLPGHHLARWLVRRGHAVAYVSAPVSPWHFLSGARRADVLRRWNQEGALGRWRHERLFAFVPRTLLPIHRQWPFDGDASWKGSERLSFPRAGEILREAGFARADVLAMHNLQMPQIVRHVQPKAFVLRIEDDVAGFADMPRAIVRHEADMIADADLVTITAESLRAKAEEGGAARIHPMPNGVDFRLFARPAMLPARPAELPDGPVAIYTGALDSWFDEELLVAVAEKLRHWRFVLVGPRRAAMEKLRGTGNVRFLDGRPQEQLPPLLWHADAAIIPFRRIPLIESVCPLKLFEYCAAGLPTVSTRWREMELLRSPAKLAATAEEFAEALETSRDENREARERRVEWARGNDWNARFESFMGVVRETIAANGY